MKYNSKSVATNVTTNYKGAKAYKFSPAEELLSLLSNGIGNEYYQSEKEREKRIESLVHEVGKKDPVLLAQILIYVRSVVGQRSSVHFASAAAAPVFSGTSIGRKFYSKRDKKAQTGGVVYRLDDLLEIAAVYFAKNEGKSLPNAMKKGFADAISSADPYEIAKYKSDKAAVSLVDIVNLTHPKSSGATAKAIADLIEGNLKQFNTVEDKNTTAGQEVAEKVKSGEISKEQAEAELKETKASNYAELIETRKIGYLALLRNMRNIMKTGDAVLLKNACELLKNQEFIKKSLVWPHQIDLAIEELEKENSAQSRLVVAALGEAYDKSVANLEDLGFDGESAVVFDSSASMGSNCTGSNKRAIDKAALIAATFAKGVNGDIFHFADYAVQIPYNLSDSVNTIKNKGLSQRGVVGYGTNMESVFSVLKKAYKRIYIISDMQTDGYVMNALRSYKQKFGVNPYIYCVNLVGYGNAAFNPRSGVFNLHGYGADIYEVAKKFEIDPAALMNEVKKIQI